MSYLSHFLVFIILIILPLTAAIELSRLKKNHKPEVKEKAYIKIFAWYTIVTIGFAFSSPLKNVFFISDPIAFNNFGNIIFILVSLYLFFSHVFPVILLFCSEKFRGLTSQSFKDQSFIFPTTDRQRKLFWIVPITVGICEEIIFRGYLYKYFLSAPYNLSAILSFLLVTVIFGVGHFQQGLSGIILTTLLGFFLGYLYYLTGSLLLPIVIHILFDAKLIFISAILNKNKAKTKIV